MQFFNNNNKLLNHNKNPQKIEGRVMVKPVLLFLWCLLDFSPCCCHTEVMTLAPPNHIDCVREKNKLLAFIRLFMSTCKLWEGRCTDRRLIPGLYLTVVVDLILEFRFYRSILPN